MSFDELLRDGRVERVRFRPVDAWEQLNLAYRDLRTADGLLESNLDWAYIVAYNAALQAARALLFAHGFRPTGGEQHVTAVLALSAAGVDADTVDVVDRMRRKRHKVVYDQVGLVSRGAAMRAIKTAGALVEQIETMMIEVLGERDGRDEAEQPEGQVT